MQATPLTLLAAVAVLAGRKARASRTENRAEGKSIHSAKVTSEITSTAGTK